MAVGFRDLFGSRSPARLPVAPLTLWLEERDWDTEGGDGEQLDGHGFGLRDEDDRALAWDDPILADAGIFHFEGRGNVVPTCRHTG